MDHLIFLLNNLAFRGGAISTRSNPPTDLFVTNTSFHNNTAAVGGAIFAQGLRFFFAENLDVIQNNATVKNPIPVLTIRNLVEESCWIMVV